MSHSKSLFFALCTTPLLAGCASSTYFGIDTDAGPTPQEQAVVLASLEDPPKAEGPCYDYDNEVYLRCDLMPLSGLALEASDNNRHAQLELGKRFEDGRGVEEDLDSAEWLYHYAATATGPVALFLPNSGVFLPLQGTYKPGLREARNRLEELQHWREEHEED
ncbi:MAG: hypothetical protein AAF707_08700 [Pseudomonadota bacterium]